MEQVLVDVVNECKQALEATDPKSSIEAAVLKAAKDPAVANAIAKRTKFSNLQDLAIHRSERLTLLAGALPPGFVASPHNHNLWSVVGVCSGQEDNQFYERTGDGLRQIGEVSVVGPGVIANDADVIHSIRNPLDTPLVALHAYAGDLFGVPRSNWDPKTNEEVPFDWQKVRSD